MGKLWTCVIIKTSHINVFLFVLVAVGKGGSYFYVIIYGLEA